jgi:hypothetical protein
MTYEPKPPADGWTLEDLEKFRGKCPICGKILEMGEPVIGLHFMTKKGVIVNPYTGQTKDEYEFLGICEKHENSYELDRFSEVISELYRKHGIEVIPEVSASESHERKLEQMVKKLTGDGT